MQKVLTLTVSLLIAYGAGFVGSVFTMDAIQTWYAGIVKPALNPPNWVFGPVWSLLYTLMAIAAYRVYEKRNTVYLSGKALNLYALQLAANALWSYAFFGLHNPLLALAVIVVLLLSIVLTGYLFYKVDRPAGYLFIPYILWVLFATYLNVSIVLLN